MKKILFALIFISVFAKAQTVSVSVTDVTVEPSKDTTYKVIEFIDKSVVITETKVYYKEYEQSIKELQRDSSDTQNLLLNYTDAVAVTEKKLSEILSNLKMIRDKK